MHDNTITIYYDDECIICKTGIFCLKFDSIYTVQYVSMRDSLVELPTEYNPEDGFIIYHKQRYYQGLDGIEELGKFLAQKSIFRTITRTMCSIPILGKTIYASLKILRKVLLKIQGKQSL